MTVRDESNLAVSVAALRARGVSQREISRRLGVSRDVVRQASAAPWPRSPTYTPEVTAEAVARYRRGDKVAVIALELRVGVDAIRIWARAAGLPPRPGRDLKWRAEWTEPALEMKRGGATWAAIGAHYGVDKMTCLRQVSRAIREGRMRA